MSLLRAFVALEIPLEIQDAIQQATAGLRKALGPALVRWVPPHNVHLTLKFLGDVSPANLEMLQQMLVVETEQQPCFEFEVSGLGIFPTPRRPRVLWIGIQAPATLESLQRSIEAAAERLGYEAEGRPFSPHLTIGRVRQHLSSDQQRRVREAVKGVKVGSLGQTSASGVVLFRSDLQSSGAVYTPLFTTPLGNHSRGDF
jgi:2'-5' RNA ligase